MATSEDAPSLKVSIPKILADLVVKMATVEQADAAKEGLQGEAIQGRILSIEKARRSSSQPNPWQIF